MRRLTRFNQKPVPLVDEISMMSKKMTLYNDYTPDGRKLSSRHYGMVPKGNGSYRRLNTTDLYIDGLILRDGVPFMWQFDGGYVSLNANATPTSWNYYITDHLGSTRKVVDSNNNVKGTINYYPFGSEMRMQDPAQMAGDSWQSYRFTGKELDKQNGLNWYDFGARWFDVAGVPMWTSVDPLAEKYYNVSPYAYCNNNPVMFIDPDGRDYWSTNNKEEIVAFLNAIGNSQTQFDFSKWEHATDAEICGNLTYNDETHKFYTSYTSVVDGELTVIGKSFDANITPVSYSGLGYEGAYVYQPTTSSWKKIILSLDGGLKYNDGQNNWNVNLSGRITGLAPIEGVVDINTPAQRSKAIMTLLSKGAKVCKSFGTKHGEKIFQLGNRYYSFDNTQHNGGIYKVFEREGGNLKRIGTADKDLRIFKK